ncbi:hypothetical protein TDB9533_03173 [Thalassocella blandensis]|nr:hypothetical protein TDB9533_03173 [Thalassocella blandensis]
MVKLIKSIITEVGTLKNTIPKGIVRAYEILASVALLSFILFIAGLIYLGGDALNGKIVDDAYFVGMHGEYYEVSKAVYLYSKWHTLSIFASFWLFLVGPFGVATYRVLNK